MGLENLVSSVPCEQAKRREWGKITSLQKPGSSIPKQCLVGVGGHEFPAWLPHPPCSNPAGIWKEFSIPPVNSMVTVQAGAMGLLGASSPGPWRHTLSLKGQFLSTKERLHSLADPRDVAVEGSQSFFFIKLWNSGAVKGSSQSIKGRACVKESTRSND